MRYLFTTTPSVSFMLPLVPLAQAALAAGHEVLVASGGPACDTAARAGLHAVRVGDDRALAPYAALARRVSSPEFRQNPPGPEFVTEVAAAFGEVSARLLDGLVDVVDDWQPDAVFYPSNHVAGLVAARSGGAVAVNHGIGTPRPTFVPALRHLEVSARRYRPGGPGETGADEADVFIDVSPASLGAPHGRPDTESTVLMRYRPYQGGAVFPRTPASGGDRPRVVATFGSLPAMYGSGELLRSVVRATRALGVELVLAAGDADLTALEGESTGHVTRVGWTPLSTLLRSEDVLIHHGGLGSTYSALDRGVPQLTIPLTGPESTANGRVVAERGAGLLVEPETVRSAGGPRHREDQPSSARGAHI